jgi:hypothetical protein
MTPERRALVEAGNDYLTARHRFNEFVKHIRRFTSSPKDWIPTLAFGDETDSQIDFAYCGGSYRFRLRGGLDASGNPVTYIVSMHQADAEDTTYQQLHTVKVLIKKQRRGDQIARSALLSKDGQAEIDDESAFYYLMFGDK